MLAGRRIIASAERMNGFPTYSSRPAPILPDESDLARTHATVGHPPVGGAVLGDGEDAVGSRQPRKQAAVELVGNHVELRRVARSS